MEKKSDKKVAVPKSAPRTNVQDRAPWIHWIAPALHDKLTTVASAASAHPAEPDTLGAALNINSGSIPRARSSRLLQRCKSLWKLTPSQIDLNAAAIAVE